jgi:ParB family chromosome partitioning protein
LLGTTDLERERLREIDIDRILPNANQPRKVFDEAALDELAESIKMHGLVQPVIVQPLPDDFFQLVAGERRWRAAQRAGLTRLSAIVRDAAPEAALEIALIENIQREDLNPIEEAQAYEHLINEFDLTQEEVSRRVGKSRATVANLMRLLKLPDQVRQWVMEDKISAGHAKALLALSDINAIVDSARKIIEGGFSVRQAEALVAKNIANPPTPSSNGRNSSETESLDPNVLAAIHALEQALGTKVVVHEYGGKGKFEIHFFSAEEMNRIYDGLIRAKF